MTSLQNFCGRSDNSKRLRELVRLCAGVCWGRGSHVAVRRQRACVSSLRHVGLSGSNAIISLGTQPPYLLSYFISARTFFFSVFR